jgi:hypothetical protein
MENSNIDETIRRLDQRVSSLTGYGISSNSNFMSSVSTSYIYYGCIPIIIALFLAVWKPSFIIETTSIDGEYPQPHVIYKKLLLSTLVLSTMIGVAIFVYFYRKNTSI